MQGGVVCGRGESFGGGGCHLWTGGIVWGRGHRRFEAGSSFMGLECGVVVAAVKGCVHVCFRVRVVIIAGSWALSLWALLLLWALS